MTYGEWITKDGLEYRYKTLTKHSNSFGGYSILSVQVKHNGPVIAYVVTKKTTGRKIFRKLTAIEITIPEITNYRINLSRFNGKFELQHIEPENLNEFPPCCAMERLLPTNLTEEEMIACSINKYWSTKSQYLLPNVEFEADWEEKMDKIDKKLEQNGEIGTTAFNKIAWETLEEVTGDEEIWQ